MKSKLKEIRKQIEISELTCTSKQCCIEVNLKIMETILLFTFKLSIKIFL